MSNFKYVGNYKGLGKLLKQRGVVRELQDKFKTDTKIKNAQVIFRGDRVVIKERVPKHTVEMTPLQRARYMTKNSKTRKQQRYWYFRKLELEGKSF